MGALEGGTGRARGVGQYGHVTDDGVVCSVFISRHKYNRFIKKNDVFAENEITIRYGCRCFSLPTYDVIYYANVLYTNMSDSMFRHSND